MKKSIKIVGFYDLLDSDSERVSSHAAVNKINYVAHSLNEIGYHVHILSPSWLKNNSNYRIKKGNTYKISDFLSVSFPTSWKTRNRIALFLKISYSMIWLFLVLLLKTKKYEKVLIYHVPWISVPVRLSKFFKKYSVILEVEEIYQDVTNTSERFKRWENKLLKSADKYIFSTDLLRNKINRNVDSLILYGEYKEYEVLSTPLKDGKIHLLYAGIIDDVKKGAFFAIDAAKFLDDKYVLHIIGFGDVEKIINIISDHNKKFKCKIFFDGLKSGREYIEYCQKCHIGLSTQSNEGKYLESSFPSKILSYLSLGLKVVSADIECVKRSSISQEIEYYSDNTGEAISKAIKNVDISTKKRNIVNLLHANLLEDLVNFLDK